MNRRTFELEGSRKLFNQRVQVVWTEHSSSRFPRAFLLIIVAVSRNREEGKHCSRRCYVGDGDDRSWSRPWSNRSVYYISNLARISRIHYYPGETRIKSRGSCPDNASSVAHPVNAKFDTNDSRGIEIESSSTEFKFFRREKNGCKIIVNKSIGNETKLYVCQSCIFHGWYM